MDVAHIHLDYSNQREFNVACFSDLHLTAKDANKPLCKKHLDEAAALGARMNFNGDIAELIVPSDRKRYSRGQDSCDHDAHLNDETERVYAFLAPYVDFIDTLGEGNHEVTTLKYHHYDLVRGVITLLNKDRAKSLAPIHHGGYKGFIRYWFRHGKNRSTRHYDIFKFHGKGGAAAVTKGVIDFNRIRTTYRADAYWMAHKHTGVTDPYMVEIGLNTAGDIGSRRQIAFFTPGYKLPFEQKDYNDHGYEINFSDETFLTANANGYGLLKLDLTNAEIHAELVQK